MTISQSTKALIGFVGGPLAVAQVLSFAALPHIRGWYKKLNKPKWTPPNWVFGPAWGIMYTLMGYSGYRVLFQQGIRGSSAKWWGAQLLLNFAWQPLFFNAHALDTALADIVALDIAIAGTIYQFQKTDKRAAALLAPYLAWTMYATALNAKIAKENPGEGTPQARRKAAELNASEAVEEGKLEEGVSYADKLKAKAI